MSSPFDAEYQMVSEVLLDYGCLVVPHILGGERNALHAYCQALRSNPPASDAERATVERELGELLTNCVYNPNYRAFYVHAALRSEGLREFSHLIEAATFHYYRGDYLSCVLTLLPGVEGTLLAYAGWSFGASKPSPDELRACLRGNSSAVAPDLRALYGDTLAKFHERWLWRHTSAADFTLSYLNRHYALHGFGSQSYYRAIDCTRLLLFFGLMADLLALEGRGERHGFIPVGVPGIDRRREFYIRLMEGSLSLRDAHGMEEALLREHPRFVPDLHPLRPEEVFARWYNLMYPEGQRSI